MTPAAACVLTDPPVLLLFFLPSSPADVATDNLLDFDDNAKATAESDGNSEEGPLDNRPSETNNNPAWVTPLTSAVFPHFQSVHIESMRKCKA